MQLSLQLSKLQGTTSYFDGNMGRVGVKSDTVIDICHSTHSLDLDLNGLLTRRNFGCIPGMLGTYTIPK